MDIKLKSEGALNVKDSSGNNIVSVFENGATSGILMPMIVNGTIDEDESYFIPNEGQPTLQQAAAHFKAGGVVIAHFTPNEGEEWKWIMVTECEDDDRGNVSDLTVGNYYWVEDPVV